MGVVKGPSPLLPPSAMNFPADGVEDKAAAIALAPVNLGNEFGGKGNGDSYARHGRDLSSIIIPIREALNGGPEPRISFCPS